MTEVKSPAQNHLPVFWWHFLKDLSNLPLRLIANENNNFQKIIVFFTRYSQNLKLIFRNLPHNNFNNTMLTNYYLV